MQDSSTARGASSPFHIALHSSKKFAVYHAKRGNTLAGMYASFHQFSKSAHFRQQLPAEMSSRQGKRNAGLEPRCEQ
jgi:hypothetical protein